MNNDIYRFQISHSFLRYEFYSEGPRGSIAKRVTFKQVDHYPGIFNLGFGDVTPDGQVNDLIVTDNKDSRKVFATIATIISSFFEVYPERSVHFRGSTAARNRLYRMEITKNQQLMEATFLIFGRVKEQWYYFNSGYDYEAFLVRKKYVHLK
jgi:hypothetical protein